MSDNRKLAFKKWFNTRWAEWDAQHGQHSTQEELARYLDVSRSSIAQYLSMRNLPEGQNLLNIARKFGDDVYQILGVEKPEPEVPPEFADLEEEVRSSLKRAGVPIGSPESVAMVMEIVSDWLSRRKETS